MTMEVLLKNNTDGTTVGVSKDNQLKVLAESQSLQHFVSLNEQNTYQVIGTATIANATTTVLHIKNDDPDKWLVVTYMRVQTIDAASGTALPSANTYFDIGFDRTVSSGGSAVTPVNMNAASGKVASITATAAGPTMAGTFAEIDRWYCDADAGAQVYKKEGSLILGLTDTLEIRLTSDHTSGTAYARVTFMMIERNA